MKTSEKLAEVKKHIVPPHLADGATYPPSGMYYSPIQAAKELYFDEIRTLISGRMNGWLFMWDWLLREALVKAEDITPFRAQNHCLNWMDELIKEFKAKGD